MVTCGSFHHIWLNEGFATYGAALWTEAKYGKQRFNPESFRLHPVYTNPFNARATIQFELKINSHASVVVYDLSGKKVDTIVDRHFSAGRHSFKWNGRSLSSGVYFIRMEAKDFHQIQKAILLK